jgi:hypothetical protein
MGFQYFSGFITGLVRGIVGGTLFFRITVEDMPAGSQLEQPLKTRQRKAFIMNQMGNLPYLSNIEIGVYTIIGPWFPPGFH